MVPRPISPLAGRPFVLRLSLALDALIIALERPRTPPARREALRREKMRLERAAPLRGAQR